jgi:hypothetical protein
MTRPCRWAVTPYGMVPSISFPGSTGGGSNDGGSFDPVRGAVSYRGANGKQYVVISGPRLVAYALP